MAKPLDMTGIEGLSAPSLCTIECSVVTGFETVAQEEVKEKFGEAATVNRGRIIADVPLDRVKEILDLRCVDNAWVLIGHNHNHPYPQTSTQDQLQSLIDFCNQLDWTKALEVWKKVVGFQGNLYPQVDQRVKASNGDVDLCEEEPAKKARTEVAPTFRCTVYRSGNTHLYSSPEAQVKVGGAVQDKFHWGVKMKESDLDVTLNCDIDQVYLGIRLTSKSLHKGRQNGGRTITHFGPTTLRPTICAGLVRLAKVLPGEVVLDPMCGGGSIPLEGELISQGMFLGGEIHDMAIGRCRDNLSELVKAGESRGRVNFVNWDVLRVPLRDNCVDVVVTDLPFGKRSGSKADNRDLYPKTLISLARVVRPGTGRAVLLTHDMNSMIKTLAKVKKYWKNTKTISANIGGLKSKIFLLSRVDDAEVSKQEKL